ncbi:hypothetical protein [Azotosporobacter soli]|uniref:hypothetical protein n=1 Tax=Azotosporobacter soli TaxID=3055040 RepID=UPI0031FF1CB8
MAKIPKIPKGRSDKDMFVGFSETPSFENQVLAEEAAQPKVKATTKSADEGFLTSALKEKVERALLEQKLYLYKQGMVDYEIKVSCQAGQVLLTAVAKPPRKG